MSLTLAVSVPTFIGPEGTSFGFWQLAMADEPIACYDSNLTYDERRRLRKMKKEMKLQKVGYCMLRQASSCD